MLDTRALDIFKITDHSNAQELKYSVGAEGYVGSKLEIQLPAENKNVVEIEISYATTKNCTALQWLTPAQTAGKRQPYLFSQCQAIHARSMVPCQDTPSVKTPYKATVCNIDYYEVLHILLCRFFRFPHPPILRS